MKSRVMRRAAAVAVAAALAGSSSALMASAQASAAPGGVAKAKALVKAAEKKAARFIPPGPAFKASKAAGKTVFYITYSSSTVIDEWKNVASGQLQRYGVDVKYIDGNASISDFNQAIQEAIAQHAGAILLMGIDPTSVAGEVQAAKEAKIPVLIGSNEQVGVPKYPGVVGAVTINGVAVGNLLADWMVATSNGNVDAAIVTHEGVLGTAQEVGGIRAQLKRLCPSCKAKVVNLPFTQINTEAQLTQSLITSDPNLNFVIPVYDFELATMQPAVISAGAASRVKLGSFNALPNILTLMQKGGPVQADVGSPNVWFGYSIADQLLRVLAGAKPVASENNPLRLFVPSNVESLDLSGPTATWYGSINYKADYQKLWGKP